MKKCRDIMTKDPTVCLPDDSAVRVAKLMKTENIGSVPIVQDRQNRTVAGIVTDRDLAIQIIADGRDPNSHIGDFMTRSPVTCGPDDDLQSALRSMEKHQVRRIPVVENGRLVGIIAQADIATRIEEPGKTAEVVEEISKPSTMRAR